MPPAVYALRPPQNSAATNLSRAQFVLNLINTEIEISIRVVEIRATYIEMCSDALMVLRNCAVPQQWFGEIR